MLFTPFAIPVLAILAVFAYCIVDAIAKSLCESRKHRIDADLKIALADRGMSAAEIERVVAASVRGASETVPYRGEQPAAPAPLPPRKQMTPSKV